MSFLWKSQFILGNLVALALLKIVVPYDFQLAAIDAPVFSSQDILSETNNFRVANGLESLQESIVLNVAAAQKLDDMLRNQYFAHVSPSGISPWHWFEVNGYTYSFAGENLAMGFLDAQSTLEAWAESPSHRRNLLDSNYRQIGIAVIQGKIKDIEGNIVVQLFGAQVEQRASENTLTLSFSGTKAEEEPTPTPFQAPIVPLYVNSDANVPIENNITQTHSKTKLSQIITNSFLIYSFLTVLIAVGYMLVRGFTRQRIATAIIYIAIFYAVALIPSWAVVRSTFIG